MHLCGEMGGKFKVCEEVEMLVEVLECLGEV